MEVKKLAVKQMVMNTIGNALKKFEFFGGKWSSFGALYGRLFYQHMVKKELNFSSLETDASLLHLGCGPYPFTALILAEKGYYVDAVDRDPEVLSMAQNVIQSSQVSDRINLINGEGTKLDYSTYDAVWISFSVSPRYRCIQQVLKTLKSGGQIIYRNPRGWLSNFYECSCPEDFKEQQEIKCVKQKIGKESIVIEK